MNADLHSELRQSLGVYVLGALEPAERDRVERHLSVCAACREELARLAVLPSLLSRLDDQMTQPAPEPPRLAEVLVRVGRERRRARRRSLALAIGAAVATAVAVVAIVAPGALRPPAGAAQVYVTEDGSATASVEPRAWGMAVRISAELPPEAGYVAVAVADDGHRAQLASWSDVGRPVAVQGSCYLDAGDVQRLEILAAPDEQVLAVLTPQ